MTGAVTIRSLRVHQIDAIARLRASLGSGKRRPVLQLATGSGKTFIASEIIRSALGKGKRVCFTVPALSLVDQTLQAFWRDGVREVGVIQGHHGMEDWSQPVQVASVQTLARRGFPRADLVIVDECHRRFAVIEKWMADSEFAKVPFIGLSATPWTRGLGKFYDDLICPIGIEELIAQGFLSRFRVFAPSHPDLSSVRTVAGDYHEGDLSEAMDQAPLVADVAETWLRLGENRPTLCFAVDRAHARHLQDRFNAIGVPAGYIDAETDPVDRLAVKRQLDAGEISVVCNIATLLVGVDWDVRCISWARPTKSEMLFVQAMGRGLRTAPGKENLIFIDHSDTVLRLGFPTEIHHPELDDGKPKKKPKPGVAKEKLPVECPKCSALKSFGLARCGNCGFKPELPRENKTTIDGELREIVRGKGTVATGPKNTITLRGRVIPLNLFYGQLLTYARANGYKIGWVSHKFKEAAKTWPDAYRHQSQVPLDPDVMSWIKSRQIKYAKEQRKAAEAVSAPPAE